MSESRASLAGLIKKTGADLNILSDHLRTGIASATELTEGSKSLFALADALKLYAEKMPESASGGRHSLRQQPHST